MSPRTLTGSVFGEVLVLWLGTLLAIRAVVMAVEMLGLHEVFLALVPVLFMYTPVLLCRWRGVESDAYLLALPWWDAWREWWSAIKLNLVVIAVLFLPWLLAYHLWQTTVFGLENRWTWPSQPLLLVLYHLFYVAIPEEMFYRGYIQTRLDEAWPPGWAWWGARVGPALLVTCVIFAFGHSIVQFQWWHFAIFFPSLLFGWMRSRTGGIPAGALFHAWSNVTVTTLDTLYGIVPP